MEPQSQTMGQWPEKLAASTATTVPTSQKQANSLDALCFIGRV